jgi:hypothetical protein
MVADADVNMHKKWSHVDITLHQGNRKWRKWLCYFLTDTEISQCHDGVYVNGKHIKIDKLVYDSERRGPCVIPTVFLPPNVRIIEIRSNGGFIEDERDAKPRSTDISEILLGLIGGIVVAALGWFFLFYI